MRAQTKLQIVVDTNVWISGLVFGGNPEKVIRLFVDGKVIVVTSEELLSELRNKVTRKFPLFLPHLPLLEASVRERSIIVPLGTQAITISRDADDDKLVETAITGRASFIVTGDKDLLTLQSYEGIKILGPADFLLRAN